MSEWRNFDFLSETGEHVQIQACSGVYYFTLKDGKGTVFFDRNTMPSNRQIWEKIVKARLSSRPEKPRTVERGFRIVVPICGEQHVTDVKRDYIDAIISAKKAVKYGRKWAKVCREDGSIVEFYGSSEN